MDYYSTIDDVRMRGLPESSSSATDVESALKLAKELIDAWCGQDFDSHDDVEIRIDGNDGARIVFGIHIRSVNSLSINGTSIPSGSIVNYSDSMIGEIGVKDGYCFTRGLQNVTLNADTGWSQVPYAVEEASAHLASMILNRQLFSGRPEIPELKTEFLSDYSRRRFSPDEIKGIIEQDPYLFGLLRPFRIKGGLV